MAPVINKGWMPGEKPGKMASGYGKLRRRMPQKETGNIKLPDYLLLIIDYCVATYNHYYELPVYKNCRAFRKKIYGIIKKYFPKSESFQLKTQVVSSSRSITANIAEGFGRFHYQENIQFCRQSRGSLSETLEHMITAFDENILSKEILKEVNKDYKTCLKELNGYIKYLKTAKEKGNNQ